MIHRLEREQEVYGDPGSIWDFFASPHNLERITPPSLSFRIIGEVAPRMFAGQLIEYRVGVLPGVRTRWLTEITHVREGEYFVDEQRLGPYRLWHHEHHFSPIAGGLHMTDRVTYEVGFSFLGEALHALWIRRELARIFDYRRRVVADLFPRVGA